MTVRELRDILLKYECEGFEEANVEICYFEDNPVDSTKELYSIIQMNCTHIETNNESKTVVIMYE